MAILTYDQCVPVDPDQITCSRSALAAIRERGGLAIQAVLRHLRSRFTSNPLLSHSSENNPQPLI